jgi:hypothetical protein
VKYRDDAPATVWADSTSPTILDQPLITISGQIVGWLDDGSYKLEVDPPVVGATFSPQTVFVEILNGDGVVTELATKQDVVAKGQPNGYAALDSSGKVPAGQLPVSPAAPDLSGLQATIEKNQPNGYAGLGGDGKVVATLLPDTMPGNGGAQQVFVQETQPSVAYPCIWVVTDSAGNPTGEIRAENSGAYPVVDNLGIPAALIDALGDLVVGTGNDTAARLPRGTTGQVLAVNTDGSLHWIDPPVGGGVAGIDPAIFDAKGDLIVASAADTAARLARGTTGQLLSVTAGGDLAWVDAPTGGGTTLAAADGGSATSTYDAADFIDGGTA